MIWSTFLIALRAIVRNKMRSGLTMLGIVIGVGAVIAMVMLGDGASANVAANISALGEDLLVLTPGATRRGPGGPSSTAPAFELEDAAAIEREIPGLVAVAPGSSTSSIVVLGADNWRTEVVGTTLEYFEINQLELSAGRLPDFSGGRPICVLGSTVRDELFGETNPIDQSVRIGKVSCLVVGLLAEKSGSSLRDPNDTVIMPLRTFQRRISGSTDVTQIHMTFGEGRSAALVSHQIELLMRERRRISPGDDDDFHIRNPEDILETMSGVTSVLTILLGSIAAISLVVGGIGIMNIMLVSVTERTREIGIRLAIGARGREVLLQFLIEAVVLSTLGGILGVLFGISVGYVATTLMKMPLIISAPIIVIALLFSGFVGVLFGYLPARKAALLRPIDALRHE